MKDKRLITADWVGVAKRGTDVGKYLFLGQ